MFILIRLHCEEILFYVFEPIFNTLFANGLNAATGFARIYNDGLAVSDFDWCSVSHVHVRLADVLWSDFDMVEEEEEEETEEDEMVHADQLTTFLQRMENKT